MKDGSLKESVIDVALRHTVGLRFRLGLFVRATALASVSALD